MRIKMPQGASFFICACAFLLLSCSNDSANQSDTAVDPISRVGELNIFKTPELSKDTSSALGEEHCTGIPTKISDFNSDWTYRFYRLTSVNSAEAGVLGFKGTISKKEVVLVKDYSLSRDGQCNGKDIRFGIGLRLFVKVKSTKKTAEIGTIPKVAASVEFNKAEASYELTGYGFNIPSGTIDDTFNQAGESMTVDDYAKVTVAFNKVASALKDGTPGLTLNPKKLPKN